MPAALTYLAIMLAVIIVWFLLLKRPVYEAVLISFIILLTITGTWGNVLGYIDTGLKTSLLYSMTAFCAMSILLTKTKVIDSAIAIILALLGRVTGGAGYVSVVASSFMGALSGSGPGNVMATGSITIPAMKKSGFPAELAANIESNASYLGNMIPPSGNITAALGALTGMAAYGEGYISQAEFWIVLWGCSLWFILQRLIMVFAFCKTYKVAPMAKEDLPSLKETFKKGWQGLLLPLIILVPFILDYFFKSTFFTDRLGKDGAKYMSSSLLIFIGIHLRGDHREGQETVHPPRHRENVRGRHQDNRSRHRRVRDRLHDRRNVHGPEGDRRNADLHGRHEHGPLRAGCLHLLHYLPAGHGDSRFLPGGYLRAGVHHDPGFQGRESHTGRGDAALHLRRDVRHYASAGPGHVCRYEPCRL